MSAEGARRISAESLRQKDGEKYINQGNICLCLYISGVAVISAINKPEITREALLAGARGFITKPFNESDFLCKVRMALED